MKTRTFERVRRRSLGWGNRGGKALGPQGGKRVIVRGQTSESSTPERGRQTRMGEMRGRGPKKRFV